MTSFIKAFSFVTIVILVDCDIFFVTFYFVTKVLSHSCDIFYKTINFVTKMNELDKRNAEFRSSKEFSISISLSG